MGKPPSATRRDLLTILDVGHGNCAVVSAGGRVIVIDTGSGSALQEFLTQTKLRKLHSVVLTHADEDHIGGLVGLISSQVVDVDRVYVNADAVKQSKVWEDLRYVLNRKSNVGKIRLHTALTRADTGQLDVDGTVLEILAPTPYLTMGGPGSVDRKGRRITSNTVSVVIRVKTEAGPVALLASDLDGLGLEYLLDAGGDVSAPFLVFPHHGGKPGTEDGRAFAKRMCEAVKPDAVLFSIGRGRYATPNPDVIAGVLEARPKCWIACTQLSQNCAAHVLRHDARHLSDAFSQGREAGRCCAGSIVIPLRKPKNSKPTCAAHSAFVKKAVESPLCRPAGGASRRRTPPVLDI